jgi:hypothetical protein
MLSKHRFSKVFVKELTSTSPKQFIQLDEVVHSKNQQPTTNNQQPTTTYCFT